MVSTEQEFRVAMEHVPNLVKTFCAICETDTKDKVVYPQSFVSEDLSFDVFSARRSPDRIHYRIVRCQNCGLVRSNPILNENMLAHLYSGSHFTYARESGYAAETYLTYLKKALVYTGYKIRLLEIGCGNGAFLKKAKLLGLKEVSGIEPSQEAVEQAGELRPNIRKGMFAPGLYAPDYFDVICAFQVFDHISTPNSFINQCHENLKTGGVALFINHDIDSLFAKILGRKCPMVDIEHTYLYNKSTLRKIFEKNDFEVLYVFSVVNRYPLAYWLKLAPLPPAIKKNLLAGLDKTFLANLPLCVSAGNIGIIARKQG